MNYECLQWRAERNYLIKLDETKADFNRHLTPSVTATATAIPIAKL